ncbi:unnamed protein product [Danaus chrysippus]|uniref:(African queen) hypothetical protein n=1 Tax=Danaus chrysippus TaxID=151541 RepID=A0A8J2VTP5_9NEOP|nr:unnamed protein product [Danaus chrysippus]
MLRHSFATLFRTRRHSKTLVLHYLHLLLHRDHPSFDRLGQQPSFAQQSQAKSIFANANQNAFNQGFPCMVWRHSIK